MERADGFALAVYQQHRKTVSSLDGQHQTWSGGQDAISAEKVLRRAINSMDYIRVNLPQARKRPHGAIPARCS
jgi:hypothetical protein